MSSASLSWLSCQGAGEIIVAKFKWDFIWCMPNGIVFIVMSVAPWYRVALLGAWTAMLVPSPPLSFPSPFWLGSWCHCSSSGRLQKWLRLALASAVEQSLDKMEVRRCASRHGEWSDAEARWVSGIDTVCLAPLSRRWAVPCLQKTPGMFAWQPGASRGEGCRWHRQRCHWKRWVIFFCLFVVLSCHESVNFYWPSENNAIGCRTIDHRSWKARESSAGYMIPALIHEQTLRATHHVTAACLCNNITSSVLWLEPAGLSSSSTSTNRLEPDSGPD